MSQQLECGLDGVMCRLFCKVAPGGRLFKKALEPYYEVERTGRHPLMRESELSKQEIADAIMSAVPANTKSTKIVYLPLSDCQESDQLLDASLSEILHGLFWEKLLLELGVERYRELKSFLVHGPWMWGLDSIKISVLFYLGFLMAGDGNGADKLMGLVQVQASCLVLGTCRNDPDTWLVVCD